MIRLWEKAVEARTLGAHVPPQLTNTDGETLTVTTDAFTFAPKRRAEIDRRLRSVDGVEGPDGDDDRYVFLRGNLSSKRRDGRTVIGSAYFADSELVVDTNSVERANRLRSQLEDSCRGLLVHARREHSDPLAPRFVKPHIVARAPEDFPGGAEIARAFKQRHYGEWTITRFRPCRVRHPARPSGPHKVAPRSKSFSRISRTANSARHPRRASISRRSGRIWGCLRRR